MAKISLIIVTYNSSKHIYDCLESVFKFNDIGEELEIVIVDNDSSEQKEMFSQIKGLYGDRIILKNSEKNGGYGYGNNIGITISTAPIAIVMNPDVRLVSPIFLHIVSLFSNKNLGMLGVSFIDGSRPFYFKPGYNTFLKSLFLKLYKKYDAKKMFMSGSFLAFNKAAFEKAGRFDEKIFMFSEEADITNRIMDANYLVEWHPEISVLHMAHGRDFNQYLTNVRYDSFEYYCVKYGVNTKKCYREQIKILRFKKLIALFIRDTARYNNFSQTLIEVRRRVGLL